ncbi:hypothetical protein UCDDS831_g02786 [Diplodia seriata]|uniref:Uncharacterized protein n=1 Tax=Diplodia seriata TaxID=420778 RepID=A0A0G2H4T5_9PEZI|nr:hypothetical protein UCDDS831_g02786 [Diplodia seriata]
MHTIPTPADTLDRPPAFGAIDYRDDPAVYTVSTRLREAWITDPALIPTAAVSERSPKLPDIGTVIRAIQSLGNKNNNDSKDADNNNNDGGDDDIGGTGGTAITSQTDDILIRALRNADTNTLHTPLRDAVYHNWNHVFWDVSRKKMRMESR